MKIPDKSLFPRAAQVVYLDTAAEGIPPLACADALAGYYRDKSNGTPGRKGLFEAQQQARCAAARLLATTPDNIAFLGNATDGLNLLANSIDWHPGDEVVITDLEFPSNVLVWLHLRARGMRVRVLQSHSGQVSYEQFADAIGPRTRLVSVSYVSYKSGARLPYLRQLADATHSAGALFCVDATQALGRVPVPIDQVDYLVASTYKWLLGTHGLGIVYLSPALRDRLNPAWVGWCSVPDIFTPDRFERFEFRPGADRLEAGMANFPALCAIRYSLELLLDADVATIYERLAPLVTRLRAGIAALGLDLLTPPGPECASGIVSFEHPNALKIGAALEQSGIIPWAGDGRVRASVHLYNDEADIERYLEALSSILPRL